MEDFLFDAELAVARRFGPQAATPTGLGPALLARLRCETDQCMRLGLRRGGRPSRRFCDHHRHGLGHGHEKEDQPHG